MSSNKLVDVRLWSGSSLQWPCSLFGLHGDGKPAVVGPVRHMNTAHSRQTANTTVQLLLLLPSLYIRISIGQTTYRQVKAGVQNTKRPPLVWSTLVQAPRAPSMAVRDSEPRFRKGGLSLNSASVGQRVPAEGFQLSQTVAGSERLVSQDLQRQAHPATIWSRMNKSNQTV